ncbi:hypothetical protein Tco_0298001, partial [Tanacetum coccineum]
QSRPLPWTLSVKDVSTDPLKFKCSACVAGEQTKVDFEDVDVIVPVKAEKVDFQKTIIGGRRYWYEPGKAKVHWLIRGINESNRT